MTNTIFALDRVPAVQHHMAVNLIKTRGGKEMVGKYTNGQGHSVIEPSFIMNTQTFQELRDAGVLPVDNQESVLEVSECNKQYAWLQFSDGRDNVYAGCLKAVSAEEAQKQDCWTYDPRYNRWFIAVDNSQSASVEETNQRRLWAAIDRVLMCAPYGAYDSLAELSECRDEMKPKWLTAEEGKKQ